MNILDIASEAVERAQSLGAQETEAYIMRSSGLEIEVHKGEVENLDLRETLGIGLRTIKDGHLGFSYTTILESDALKKLAEDSLANGQLTAPDEAHALPKKQDKLPVVDLVDQEMLAMSVEEKIELAKRAEKTAYDYDKRVTNVEAAAYGDGHIQVGIVNSHGISAQFETANCAVSISLLVSDKDIQTGGGYQIKKKLKMIDPEFVGQEAAMRALAKLGAEPMESCSLPIILDSRVVLNFLGLVLPSLNAESVHKGKSLFQNKDKVASEYVTLVDDGLLEDGLGTAPFDDEGVAQSKKIMIAGGNLNQLLHNTYSANKAGTVTTGNAQRGGFASLPEISASNVYLEPGKYTKEEIFQSEKRCFYLTEVMGLHTANPISGEFSLGARGFLVENGQKVRPVKGIAISGNLQELLNDIDMVGNDLRFYGSMGAPTVRVKRMTIAGS